MNLKDILGDAFKEGMTLEEVNEALENVTMPEDKTAEIAKLKTAVSNANSEAAKYKKELNEKLSADELKAKEDAENLDKLIKERDALLKEKNISNYKAKFLENGYTAELAEESATAMSDGDFMKVFELLGKHVSNLEKKFKAENIDNTPVPTGGSGDNPAITKEQFDKMSYREQLDVFTKQPDLYNKFTGG